MTCKDCGPDSKRPAPKPGPRCATHHRAKVKRDKARKHDLYVQKQYGLKPGEYDALHELQGGRCAICQVARGVSKKLAVDHDHSCCPGKTSCGRCVRGLICSVDNSMLAHARDDVAVFERAIQYLQNPPARSLDTPGGPC